MKTSLNMDYGHLDKQVKAIIKKAQATGKSLNTLALNTVKTLTNKLEAETVRRMPVDEAMLEKSVKSKVKKSGGQIHEIWGVVWIPANSPAADYAMYMHELQYKLGPRSQIKQDADPCITVGRKYMERAMAENKREFSLYVIKTFKEFIDD